jgi:fatty acid desaturase
MEAQQPPLQPTRRVQWYRCYVSREDLKHLNQRSDLLGFLQTLGYLGVLTLTGLAAYFSPRYLPHHWWRWPLIVAIFFIHGTVWTFLINGFHELVHDSVFKTRWLNSFFLRVFSFLGALNHHQFWASHTEHHKYTLHPPDDLEVTLPYPLPFKYWYRWLFFDYRGVYSRIKTHWRWARGKTEGKWEQHLFPQSDPVKLRQLAGWSRFVLAGHAAIIVVSILMHWWLLPVVVTFAPFYGSLLFQLCNNTQHVGLQDNVTDFRLCCRTIYLNPIVQFLYWHMNYHTEHHMYAAVPCYKLGKLHRAIKAEMPYCPNGLYATWQQIFEIQRKQKPDPTYQYTPELPPKPPRKPTQMNAPQEPERKDVLGTMADVV